MKTRVAIYSHQSRVTELNETVRQLFQVDVPVDVIQIQCEPPSQIANRRNAHAAFMEAFNDTPVLILEDDVTPNKHLRAWIEWLEETSVTTTTLYACVGKFYPSHIRKFVEEQRMVPREHHGTVNLEGLRGFYGAQGLWFPRHVASGIVQDKHFQLHEHPPYGPWDHAIREHLQRNAFTMNVTVPNIIQHRAPPSVVNRNGPRHTTTIYDEAARPPERN